MDQRHQRGESACQRYLFDYRTRYSLPPVLEERSKFSCGGAAAVAPKLTAGGAGAQEIITAAGGVRQAEKQVMEISCCLIASS